MKVVYAKTTTTVQSGRGFPVLVVWGSHWPANDPIVTQYPALFTDDPTPGLCVTREPVAEPVELPVPKKAARRSEDAETATANPGEKRTARRD